MGTSQSLYRTVARIADNKAHVHVRLPADAELWVNGQLVTPTGAERDFVSPELTAGKTYTYQITARWLRDGRAVEQTQQVPVSPNKTADVVFGSPPLPRTDVYGGQAARCAVASRSRPATDQPSWLSQAKESSMVTYVTW